MQDSQLGCCAICSSSLTSPVYNKGDQHIDHCHASGKVRGLLCSNCNTLLGVARDDPAILKEAIAYLNKTKENKDVPEEII